VFHYLLFAERFSLKFCYIVRFILLKMIKEQLELAADGNRLNEVIKPIDREKVLYYDIDIIVLRVRTSLWFSNLSLLAQN